VPASYTPRHLAEKILTSKTALEGERKQVTVLFCDLAGSTTIAERLGPDARHALVGRFFDVVLAEVHRYEGTVNQFLGDGIMALFGAPVAHEDHARRAVLAALGIQREMDSLPAPASDLALMVRIGLNTRPVVVGTIGDNLRMDYIAIGDTTNLAARLQQMAAPGEVYLSDATYRPLAPWIEAESLGTRTIRGRREPVTVYRARGLSTYPAHVRSSDGHRLGSPLVGREREMAELSGSIDRVLAGA
jgi:class 3 adenylate cyclase